MSIETREVQRDNTTFVQVTSLTSATPMPGVGTAALIQAEDADVRWTADGETTPTADVGMLLVAGETLWYTGDFSKLQFIESGGTASLNIQVFK